MLFSLSSSLAVGYSLENALEETLAEMRSFYGGNQKIVKELEVLVQKIRRRIPIEEAMEEFAEAIGLKDAYQLARVLSTGRQMGGNMEAALKKTADTINGKIEVQEEIQTMLTRLHLEMNLMRLMPVVLLLYMNSSSDFLEPLFTTIPGVLMLLLGVILYILAWILAEKIVKIEV